MIIYIAAPFVAGRESARAAREVLIAKGHEVNSRWIDSHLQENIGPKDRAKEAMIDLQDVDYADALVLLNYPDFPVTPGRFIEFGYALASGCECYVVGEPTTIFHHLPDVVVINSIEEFPNAI